MTSDVHSQASEHPRLDSVAALRQGQHPGFVGRARELRQFQAAFQAASEGDGGLVMLAGEPGIGKTALCEQLCRSVEASGGMPLVGHCYEEGSFRRPYQPFVEVFGTYLQQCDTESLTADLGPGATDLARMVPMLRVRLSLTPRPAGDPEEDRWRLLQAATDFLRSAAAKQPLLLVLEDLHDADSGTLDLLLYLARNLHGSRILVVGTYRDLEVDRAHPLSTALSELHRASNVTRVQLRGLSTDEVLRLLAETSQQTIPHPFAELVHSQTEGNPLFVHETLRVVIDAGLVERRDGALRRVGDQSLAGRIPEGLRDAVGKRTLEAERQHESSPQRGLGHRSRVRAGRPAPGARHSGRGTRGSVGVGFGGGHQLKSNPSSAPRLRIASVTRSFVRRCMTRSSRRAASDSISRSPVRWKRSTHGDWRNTRRSWRSTSRSSRSFGQRAAFRNYPHPDSPYTDAIYELSAQGSGTWRPTVHGSRFLGRSL